MKFVWPIIEKSMKNRVDFIKKITIFKMKTFKKLYLWIFFFNLGTFSVHDFVCLFKDYLVDCSNSDSEDRLEVTKWDLFSIFKFEKFKNWTIAQFTEINRGRSHGNRASMAVKIRRCVELGDELLSVSLQDQTLWRDKKNPR